MQKMICIFLSTLLMLTGCEKTEAPENPYRIKQQTLQTYQDTGVQLVRSDYSYDENSRLAEIRTYYDDAWQSTRQYTYDTYGNNTFTREAYADGTENLIRKTLTLDERNRVVLCESTFDNGRKTRTEYSYNSDGQVTKHYIYRYEIMEGTDINSFTDSTYDRKGRLIREDVRWEPNSNNNGYTLYTYEHDRLVRTETYMGKELDSYTEYTYDETGLIQTAIACKADGTLQSKHITTFDEYGNKLEVEAYAYASELARYGETDEDPDSRTINVYELK